MLHLLILLDYSSHPLMQSRVSVWHHFQAQRPQMYKQPSTPFREVNECARALVSVYMGKRSLSLIGKKIINFASVARKVG